LVGVVTSNGKSPYKGKRRWASHWGVFHPLQVCSQCQISIN